MCAGLPQHQHARPPAPLPPTATAAHYLQAQRLAALDRKLQQLALLLGGQDGWRVGAGLVEIRLTGGPVVGHSAKHLQGKEAREGGARRREQGGSKAWRAPGSARAARRAVRPAALPAHMLLSCVIGCLPRCLATLVVHWPAPPATTHSVPPSPKSSQHPHRLRPPPPSLTGSPWEKTRSTSTSGPSKYSSIKQVADRPLDCRRGRATSGGR